MSSNDAPSTATPSTALLRSNTNGFMEIGLEFKPHQQVVKVTVVSATGVRAVNFMDSFPDPYVKINVYRNNRKLCQEGKTATLGKNGMTTFCLCFRYITENRFSLKMVSGCMQDPKN